MKKTHWETTIAYILIFALAFSIGGAIVGISFLIPEPDNRCDCTVNYDNQSMSVQDAIDRIIERYDGGLTTGQTIDVKVLINGSKEGQ